MSSTTDKIKGNVNEAIGKGRKAVGEAIDDPEMEAKGRAQEARGALQKASGKVKDAAKRVVDDL
jgi:uncharacterized protein YjbJ (UPF0337 family)